MVYAIMIGVLGGSQQLVDEFAMAAGYYSILHWANQQGYRTVDFWGSKPYLTGLFYYKRKWGAAVGIPPDMPQRIWLRIRRDTPAVRWFLKQNPCIILDEQGGLWGLVVADEGENVCPEQKQAWHDQFDTPGLKGLLVRSVSDLIQGNQWPP